MSNHPIAQEELMAYLDGELSIDRAVATAAHLEACKECQALAADLQSVSRQLFEWNIEEPEGPLSDELSEAIKKIGPTTKESVRRRFSLLRAGPWPWAVGAAAVTALVLLGVIGRNFVSEQRLVVSDREVVPKTEGMYTVAAPQSAGLVKKQFTPTFAAKAQPEATAPAPSGPMIVHTAELNLTTKEFDRTQADVTRTITAYRGYIGQLSVNSPTGQGRTLTATLRVPPQTLDGVLSELKKTGRVQSESQSGEEVTEQYIDLTARLENTRHTEQRLTELLRERTGKLADVLAVEEQIDSTRGEIERMEAELKNLSKRIAFATVQLQVTEEYKEPLRVDRSSSTATQLRNAAVEGWKAVISGAIGLLVFLLACGPSLIVIGLVVFFFGRPVWKRVGPWRAR